MLKSLIEVRGVRGAALLGEHGQVLEQLGAVPDLAAMDKGSALSAAMAQALGGALRDMVIDFEDGPVLLTRLGERTLLTAFDDLANLGRLRYAVKRAASPG